MMRMLKNKQGYALITAVALIAVVMALCSMLVAHTFYGRALSQSAELRFEEDRERASEGSDFISLAEIYGDGLLDAYTALGFERVDDNTVRRMDGERAATTVSRETTQTRDFFRTVTFLYGDGERLTLQVPRGEAPGDAGAPCESGYTDAGGVYRWFIGWDCDGDGVDSDYRSSADIPAKEIDTEYRAVYAESAGFTLTVVVDGEDGEKRTEIPYSFGETLAEVLAKTKEEGEPYLENAEDHRFFARYERNIGDALGRYLTAENAEELREALAQCEAGEKITVTGALEEPVYVDRAVTIRIGAETELLPPADGFSVSVEQHDAEVHYRYEALSKVHIKDSTGETPKVTEYRGTLADIVKAVNEIGGESCYANEACTIPGICVMGDTVLQDDLKPEVPLVVFPGRTVTLNLNGHTIAGGEVLFRLESGSRLSLVGGTLSATKTLLASGTALQNIGGKAFLTDVHVKGDLLSYQGAETKLVGGSLAGLLNVWGSGSLSVEGSVGMPFVLDGSTVIAGSAAAEFTLCRFASGSFRAESSTAAVLRLCEFSADPLVEKSGSYYELNYAGGSQQSQTERFERLETLLRPVDTAETLCGAPVLYAAPADAGLITYYDAEGVPVKTVLFTEAAEFTAEAYVYRGETVDGWAPLDGTEDAEELVGEDGFIADGTKIIRDLEVRPVFQTDSPAKAAAISPDAGGLLEMRYYAPDLNSASGFREVTAVKTLRGGDRPVLAYYAPGQPTPEFFVSGTKTAARGTADYEEYLRAAGTGGEGSCVVVPICAFERISWSRMPGSELDEAPQEWSGEQTEFPAGSYVQGYSVRIVQADGSECTGVCVPHGAKLCYRVYETVVQNGVTRYKVLQNIEESVTGVYEYDFFVSQDVIEQGTVTNGGKVFLYTTNENAAAREDSFRTVTGTINEIPFGGEYHYLSRSGEAVVVSCDGVPAGTDVIFAYCRENGEPLFYIDRSGTHTTDTPEALPADWRQRVSDGCYYDGSVLVVVIYQDHALTWFSPSQGTVDPWHSSAEYPLYAERQGDPCYYFTQTDEYEQETLCIGVRTTDFAVIKWAVPEVRYAAPAAPGRS